MAKLTLGTLQRDMPLSLDVSAWSVFNTTVSGTASAPGRPGTPLPGFRQDRIDFTGTTLAYDGVAKAHGFIETMSYKAYGGLGYYEQYGITDLHVKYQDVVNLKTDIMPLMLKGNDTVTGNSYDNTLYGFAGKDAINGGAGNDHLFGGSGQDVLTGGTGADELNGGTGVDTASYSIALSSIVANLLTGKGTGGEAKGDTFVSVENLTGSNFHDTLVGNNGANTLKGLAGNDWIDGGKGADQIYGGAGNDTLIGGSGNDHIYAGQGDDKVWLGSGSDTFHFGTNDQTATLYDFDVAADRVDLSAVDAVNAQNVQTFLHDTDNGVVLDLGHGDQIVFVGLHSADFGSDDFLF